MLSDYLFSRELNHFAVQNSPDGDPFYALIMTAFRHADTQNQAKLRAAWPQQIRELAMRYEAPGGMLPAELAAAEAQQRARARAAETLDRRPGGLLGREDTL